MTGDEFRGYEQRLYSRDSDSLLRRQDLSFNERLSQLKTIYNSTSMTGDQFRALERRLINSEVDRISYLPEPTSTKISRINQLYNSTSMTASERDAAVGRLMQSEYGYRY